MALLAHSGKGAGQREQYDFPPFEELLEGRAGEACAARVVLRRDSTKKSRDGGDGAFPDAAHTPSASAVSQVRAGCKSLVDSLSRFMPLAMPRRGAALLAGRMRRSAVRSIVFALLGRRAGQSRPNCLTDSRSQFGLVTGLSLTLPDSSSLSRRGAGSRGCAS